MSTHHCAAGARPQGLSRGGAGVPLSCVCQIAADHLSLTGWRSARCCGDVTSVITTCYTTSLFGATLVAENSTALTFGRGMAKANPSPPVVTRLWGEAADWSRIGRGQSERAAVLH